MRRFFLFYLLAFICGWLTSCHNITATAAQTEVAATLSDLLQEAIDDSLGEVPGVSMSVICPEKELNWNEAAGFADKLKETPLHPDQPYRIASVTKTFVAAAVLRLHETGKLNIDDPLAAHLSEEHLDLLRSDGYQVDSITLRHCLYHTSGLYDYAVSTPAYIETVMKDPARRWSRTDQLRFAMDLGEPRWPPGAGFHYSDTGYILLGEAIERAVDSTLAHGLRSLLHFEELGLQNTWLESVETPTTTPLPVVRRYFSRHDFTEYDASIDLWGGGGLLSTSKDVATFIQALFSGKVFNNPKTIDLFLEGPVPFSSPYDASKDPEFLEYRAGHYHMQLYGKPAYSHSGFWGTGYLYLPDLEATIVVNYTAGYKERLLKKTVLALRSLEE